MPTGVQVTHSLLTNGLSNQLPLGICLIDRQFRIDHWNQKLEQWTGQSAETVVGFNLLNLFPNLNQPRFLGPLTEVFARAEQAIFSMGEEQHFIPAQIDCGGGQPLMVQRTTVELLEDDPELALIMIENRSELGECQCPLSSRDEDLQRLSDQHAQFIAHLSQELKWGLHTMQGYAEFLRVRETSPECRAALEGMRRCGERTMALLDDSLDLAKLHAQQMNIESVEVELRPLVHDVISLVQITAAEQRIDFDFDLQQNVPRVIRTDPTRLRQLLLNLLTHAVEHATREECFLEVQAHKSGDDVVVAFEVSGVELRNNLESLGSAFQPFAGLSTGAGRKNTNSGLALAIGSRLAEMLGGKLEAIPEKRRGRTEFRLVLPTK